MTILTEAAWWVDAGSLTVAGDGLRDLTEQGRDALFGEGAAAPLALPWRGENYIFMPEYGDWPLNEVRYALAGPPAASDTIIELDWIPFKNGTVFGSEKSNFGAMSCNDEGKVTLTYFNKISLTGSVPDFVLFGQRQRTRVLVSQTGWTFSRDGVELASGSWTDPVTTTDNGWFGVGDYVPSAGQAGAAYYSVTVTVDGETRLILDPANVLDGYKTITNTGTLGGNWTVTRAETGSKTAVVDRPLLLFGEPVEWRAVGQHATTRVPGGVGDGTLLFALRAWEDTAQSRYWVGATGTAIGGVYAYQNSLSVVNLCYVGADISTRADIPSIGAYGEHVIGARLGDTFHGLLDGAVVSTGPMVAEGARLIHDRVGVGVPSFATSFEFLAAAVWDRALSDEEIAEASTDLLEYLRNPGAVIREGWNDGTWNSVTGRWGHGLEEEVSVPDARVAVAPADDRDGQISGDSSGLYVHSGGSDYPVIASYAQDVTAMSAAMTGAMSGSELFVDKVADIPTTVSSASHVHRRPLFFLDSNGTRTHGSSGSWVNIDWYRSSGNNSAGYVSGSPYFYIPYDGWWLLGLMHSFIGGSDAGQRLAMLITACAAAPTYWGTAGRNDRILLAGATDTSTTGHWYRSGLWLGKLKQTHRIYAQSWQSSGASRSTRSAVWGVWMGPWDSTMSWDGFH